MQRNALAATGLALLALLALAQPARAQSTWYVDVNGNAPGTGSQLDPYTSLEFAVNQPTTVTGDTLLVLPGTYAETVSVGSKGLQIVSTDGANSTVIDAGGGGSAVSFVGTEGTQAVLDGFTVRGGTGTLDSLGYTAGGGIYAEDAIVEIARSTVRANGARYGGGAYFENCVAEVVRCRFDKNDTGSAFLPRGAGLYVTGGSLFVKNSRFQNNTCGQPFVSPGRGGGMYVDDADVTINRSVFADNLAEAGGGGLAGGPSQPTQAPLTVSRTIFRRNEGQFGGGMELGSLADVANCRFESNRASSTSGSADWGGGVAGGVLRFCTLTDGSSFGGGSAAYDSVLTNCVAENGSDSTDTAFTARGALLQCVATNTTVRNNVTTGAGDDLVYGAGASESSLVGCDLRDNTLTILFPFSTLPDNRRGGGGAAASDLTDCRVFDNTADGSGGGVLDCTLTRCQVYDNAADYGGGAADGTIERSTLTANAAATQADGLFALNATVVLDSILWGNGSQEIAVDTTPQASIGVTYSDVSGGWPGTGNIDADPKFWDPAVDDFHLEAGSPCIDAGDPNSPPDPDGSRADMGALPYDPSYAGD